MPGSNKRVPADPRKLWPHHNLARGWPGPGYPASYSHTYHGLEMAKMGILVEIPETNVVLKTGSDMDIQVKMTGILFIYNVC